MAAQSPPPYDLKDGTNVSWYTNYARQSRQHNYHESADNVTSAMPMDITVESRPLSGLNSPYQGGWQSTTYEHGPWQVSGDFSHQYIHPPGHYTTVPLTDRDPLGEHSDKRDYTSTQRHGLSIAHARSGKNSKRGSVGTMLKLWSSDIAAILLAICVLVGVFVLLAYYDGKQTSTWTHPIALTTVVSILSTANSTALASVASNIISQAKWTWFWSPKTNPRLQGPPIKDMERFDQASRGVSGASSLFLRYSLRIRNPALLLALLITLLSAAISPLIQQALLTVQCDHVDEAGSATIPTLHELFSINPARRYSERDLRSLSFAAKAGIISALSDPKSKDSTIQATCTTGNCTFPLLQDVDGNLVTHRSIGFCTRCTDISSHVTHNITEGERQLPLLESKTSAWFLPSGRKVTQVVETSHTPSGYLTEVLTRFLDVSTEAPGVEWADSTSGDVMQYLSASKYAYINVSIMSINNFTADMPSISDSLDNAATVAATSCTLYPCLKSYLATIEGAALSEKLVSTSELRPYGDVLPKMVSPYESQGDQVVFPSDMISVRTPCIVGRRTYTAENLSTAPGSITLSRRDFGATAAPVSMVYNGENAPPEVNISAPPECLYALDHCDWFVGAQAFLRGALRGSCRKSSVFSLGSLCQTDLDAPSTLSSSSSSSSTLASSSSPVIEPGPFWLEALAKMPFRTRDEIAVYMDDVAESLTRRFRMGVNKEVLEPEFGWVTGQSTEEPGLAWLTTRCFAAQWAWLLLPAVLTLFAVVGLVWTLVRNASGLGTGEMVWKSSILPYIYHWERFVTVDGTEQSVDDEKRHEWAPLLQLKEMKRDAAYVNIVFQE